jgi:gliding motility-associated-like protein
VLSDKEFYKVGETVNLSVVTDPLYQMVNWNFGDNTALDSVVINPTTHQYVCPGVYTVAVNVYDTIGVCLTKAKGDNEIKVLPVSTEMIQVTTLEENDKAIQINWKIENAEFLNNAFKLNRRLQSSSVWENITNINQQISMVDENVKTNDEIYEYQIQETSTCPDQVPNQPHHNILLNAVSEDNVKAQLNWNAYDHWPSVDRYEIYLSKDKGPFNFIGTAPLQFQYDSMGFEYCFRIKAIESGGNQAFSWSNISCAEFSQPIKTYNVITPNNDNYNELFIIEGIEYYPSSLLIIYNRWGHKVKEFEGYKNNWPSGHDIDKLSSGVYYFVLLLRDHRALQNEIKGPLSIIK